MAVSEKSVEFSEAALAEVQGELRSAGVDGWLLYDFRGNNPVTAGLLGLPVLSRRVFVYVPAEGRPVALTHRIEQQPWRTWIGENRQYLSWQSLKDGVAGLLEGASRVASEYSELDAVPYLDRLPAGVAELIRESGVEVVSSGDLVSAFYSRWSEQGRESHLRAAAVLRETAFQMFAHVGSTLGAGETLTEWEVRQRLVETLHRRGLQVGADCVVAVNGNAANPHYAPSSNDHSEIRAGDTLLVDLWGKESGESIFADQTWMASVGGPPSTKVQRLWEAIRDARDAAVELIRTRSASGEPVYGYEGDRAARAVMEERGLGDVFIHRTGHSIDRDLHGSGPNLDDLETRDIRRLIEGIGFSVEPGAYLAGEVGLRTEIDVFMGPNGPEITTPSPQREMEIIPL